MANTDILPIAMLLGSMKNVEIKPINREVARWGNRTAVAIKFNDIDDKLWIDLENYGNGPYSLNGFLYEDDGVLLWYTANINYNKRISDLTTDELRDDFRRWVVDMYKDCLSKHKAISESIHKTYEVLKDADDDLKASFVYTSKVKKMLTAYKFKGSNMVLNIKVMKKGYDISTLFMGRADGIHHLSAGANVRKNLKRTLSAMSKPNQWMDYWGSVIRSTHPDYLTDYEERDEKKSASA